MKKNLDAIVEALHKDEKSLQENNVHTKKVFGDKWECFDKKLAFFYESFEKFSNFSEPITDSRKL